MNPDARPVVGAASILFPLAAAAAAGLFARYDDRPAGALLLLSVATLTYFARPLNVPALVVGLTLVIKPWSKVDHPSR